MESVERIADHIKEELKKKVPEGAKIVSMEDSVVSNPLEGTVHLSLSIKYSPIKREPKPPKDK